MKIKAFKSKSLLLSLLLIATVSFSLSAQDAQKEYKESFDVSKGVSLETDTKYSDIELLTWDKDVVDILVEVTVKASSRSKAEEKIDKIKVDMRKTGNKISLETEFDDGWSRNAKTEINIIINAPSYLNLDMDNAYGDLFIQEAAGHVLLNLRYGNLKAGKLVRGNEKPYNIIDLAYSNAVVDEAGYVELELSYSDMEMNASDMLFVESKYSKLIGESAGGIITEGAYDKYIFDRVGSFEAELRYSGIKFGTLSKELILESRYTPVKIEQLSKNFKEVNASLSYSNLYMGLESGAAFKLEGETRYGKISVSKEGKLSKKKEGSTMSVWGTIGSNPKSNMKVLAKYGNIVLE